VIERALEAVISKIVLTGTSLGGSQTALEMARQNDCLYSTAGIHPHGAKTFNANTIETLKQLLSDECCVAVGECGLDYNRNFSPKDKQIECFTAHINLANELDKPLFLHERDAFDEFYRILNASKQEDTKAVVHCFTGKREHMQAYLDMGCYIGITGWICDERRGLELKEMIQYIPADRLMLETDAPFLTPRDMRPKPKNGRNEPAFLKHIVGVAAEAVGKPVAQVVEETYANSLGFFGIG
jgi:TatD DNase family protein